MNIKEAKENIKTALQVYFQKDENGVPLLAPKQQRPILLIGPPGIGKTAIMEQIAQECQVGLVAYTMTHHTRQSAMGLPQIKSKTFGQNEAAVTEYTMSEIVASIYTCMERTGKKKGLLFLDEINCVSETLAPVMLQLLQNKTFGNQKIPEDWLIVTAGNPPEYNKSVREFDVATLDRIRLMELEPNLEIWMEYAWKQKIHGAILSYLSSHNRHFYQIEQKDGEKHFVTARGWEDLSALLKGYERMGIAIHRFEIEQYLQDEKIAGEFFSYYQIYQKYGQDYQVSEIVSGKLSKEQEEEKERMAAEGSVEERQMLMSMLVSVLEDEVGKYLKREQVRTQIKEAVRQLQNLWKDEEEGFFSVWIEKRAQSLAVRIEQELIRTEEKYVEKEVLEYFYQWNQKCKEEHKKAKTEILEMLQQSCKKEMCSGQGERERISKDLERVYHFLEKSYGSGPELTLFTTYCIRTDTLREFLIRYGTKETAVLYQMLLGREQEEVLQQQCKAYC